MTVVVGVVHPETKYHILWRRSCAPACVRGLSVVLGSTLALRFRTRLTQYIHDLYLSAAPHLRYHRVPLRGIDQYIAADVEAWSESVSGICGNLLKPSLDLLLFTFQLSRPLGFRGALLLFRNYYLTVKILRAVTPAFGRLAAVEEHLEGEYRAGVGRVCRESEEVVVLMDGGLRDQVFVVCGWVWVDCHAFVITRKCEMEDGREARHRVVVHHTETYISNFWLLLSLADASGRLMYAYKDLVEVAGLTRIIDDETLAYTHCEDVPTGFKEEMERSTTTSPDPRRLSSASKPFPSPRYASHDYCLQRVGKPAIARVLAGLWTPGGAAASITHPTAEPTEDRTGADQEYSLCRSAHTWSPGHYWSKLSTRTRWGSFIPCMKGKEEGYGATGDTRSRSFGMALSRVFYLRPKFAVLDECTSAVSSGVGGHRGSGGTGTADLTRVLEEIRMWRQVERDKVVGRESEGVGGSIDGSGAVSIAKES
ncbi:ABC transporter transmembrane region 2-domain-containing protein [Melanogaster broomeanus]|nr:ABC transporter transmembrane region 2-domain-containing protein [Melanogaster broomeanus]